MSVARKIRDQLIERFTSEFGQPSVMEEVCFWSLARKEHASLNIRINPTSTPDRVAVWLFDPRQSAPSSTERLWIEHQSEVDRIVLRIKKRIGDGE
jgi:hypothetical protein